MSKENKSSEEIVNKHGKLFITAFQNCNIWLNKNEYFNELNKISDEDFIDLFKYFYELEYEYPHPISKNKYCVKNLSYNGNKLLHMAVYYDKNIVVDYLLNGNANVDAFAKIDCLSKVKNTPLHIAASTGNEIMLSKLLALNANINAENIIGDTPMHLAARKGYTEIIKLLLANGADTTIKNIFGDSPLQDSLDNKHRSISALIQKDNDTLLYLDQIQENKVDEKKFINKEYARIILMNFISYNGLNQFKQKKNDSFLFKKLKNLTNQEYIEAIKIINESDLISLKFGEDNNSYLHMLIKYAPREEVIKYLLSTNIDIDIKNKQGETPLHAALYDNNYDIAYDLINNGADVKAECNGKFNLLHLVNINLYRQKLVELLFKNGVGSILDNENCHGETALAIGIVGGNFEYAKYLLTKGSDINHTNKDGKNILTLVIENHYSFSNSGYSDKLKFLFDNGTEINHKSLDLDRKLNIHCGLYELFDKDFSEMFEKNLFNLFVRIIKDEVIDSDQIKSVQNSLYDYKISFLALDRFLHKFSLYWVENTQEYARLLTETEKNKIFKTYNNDYSKNIYNDFNCGLGVTVENHDNNDHNEEISKLEESLGKMEIDQ